MYMGLRTWVWWHRKMVGHDRARWFW